MEKLVYDYYGLTIGQEPDINKFKRTLATACYLKDNGFNDFTIMMALKTVNTDEVKGEDLPIELWENSLLNKGVFYYSDIFHIKSKPPVWNAKTMKEESSPFFLEMKIVFTMEDLISLYFMKCRVPLAFQDNNKTKGAFEYLLKKYSKFGNIQAIDYILALINKASEDIDKDFFADVFEIEQYNKEVIEQFRMLDLNATHEKTNIIRWRS